MKYNHRDSTIETNRLQLRLFEASDAKVVRDLCNNFNIYKSTLHIPYPYSLDAALSWIATHEKKFEMNQMYELAITNKQSGTIYGAIGISHDQENKHGEIGYWIGEKYWGNGYATEAAKAIIEFVFNEKGFHRVYGRILRTNPGSGEVLKKCGMTYEGTLKDHIYKHDAFHDVVLYGRIRLLD